MTIWKIIRLYLQTEMHKGKMVVEGLVMYNLYFGVIQMADGLIG